MLITLLNDKYFKNYNKLLNYDYNKYLIICKELLFVYMFKGNKLCDFEYNNIFTILYNFFIKSKNIIKLALS